MSEKKKKKVVSGKLLGILKTLGVEEPSLPEPADTPPPPTYLGPGQDTELARARRKSRRRVDEYEMESDDPGQF